MLPAAAVVAVVAGAWWLAPRTPALTQEDELVVADVTHPVGAPAHDLPPQPAVFAPDYAPEEIDEIAQKLRKKAGLPDEPTGLVSEESQGLVGALTGKVRS